MKVKNNMKEFIKNNKLNIAITLIYSIISFIILLNHESYRDEAQAWLIARNSNITEFLVQLTYEGHSPLWYLILFPFAKLGLPYVTTKIISWIISLITVWIILKKAPFNMFIKILFIFSYPLIYLYPAISRSYCLIPLAVTIVSIYYNKRHEKPIQYIFTILLLANTHIIMYGMVRILLLIFFIEELIINRKTNDIAQKKKIYISLVIIIIGLLVVTLPIIISFFNNTDVKQVVEYQNGLGGFPQKIKYSFKLVMYNIFFKNPLLGYPTTGMMLISILFLILLTYEVKYYRKNSLIIICTAIFQLFIYAYIYACSEQKATALIFVIMFIYWIQKENENIIAKKEFPEYIMIFLLLMGMANGILNIEWEMKNKYSASEQTAEYIEKNIGEDSIMICLDMPYSSAVIPYINKEIFWSPQTENYFTYVIWNEEIKEEYTLGDLRKKLKQNFNENQKLYLLYTYYYEDEVIKYLEENNYINKLFKSDEAKQENYVIYEITEKFINIE